MRDYATFSCQFWTGHTGKQIKAKGKDAVILAVYLFTAHNSNMIGLYYLPLVTMAHESGLSIEETRKGLRSLSEVGFAHYDEQEENVWVPRMAVFQIAELLKPGDKRSKGIERELEHYKKSRFYVEFVRLYRAPFRLNIDCPVEGASIPLRSQEQEQEQEQEQDHEQEQGGLAPVAPAPKPTRRAVAFGVYSPSPEGLPPIALAAGLCDQIELPASKGNKFAVEAAIKAWTLKLSRIRGHPVTHAQACDDLITLALAAQQDGVRVDKWWFEDAKYDPENGNGRDSKTRQANERQQRTRENIIVGLGLADSHGDMARPDGDSVQGNDDSS